LKLSLSTAPRLLTMPVPPFDSAPPSELLPSALRVVMRTGAVLGVFCGAPFLRAAPRPLPTVRGQPAGQPDKHDRGAERGERDGATRKDESVRCAGGRPTVASREGLAVLCRTPPRSESRDFIDSAAGTEAEGGEGMDRWRWATHADAPPCLRLAAFLSSLLLSALSRLARGSASAQAAALSKSPTDADGPAAPAQLTYGKLSSRQ
jgi:hypothetical protein